MFSIGIHDTQLRMTHFAPVMMDVLHFQVEKYGMEAERRLFTNFHRQLFCTIDKWIELNMEDIRK